MLKVFAISDLHLATTVDKPMDIFGENWHNYLQIIKDDWQKKVSEEDIVLLPGDFSWAMKMEDVRYDFEQISGLKGVKVILRGNHDYWWNSIGRVKAALPNRFYAIQNDCIRFENVLICGTRGWTCPDRELSKSDEKIYLREIERLKLSLNTMQAMRKDGDIVICMMHFPPFNVRREDSEFTKLLVKFNIDKVVYGHLHGKDCRCDLVLKKFNIEFYLVSTDLIRHNLTQIF